MNNPSANQSQFILKLKQLELLLSVNGFKIFEQNLSSDYRIQIWIESSSPLILANLINQLVVLIIDGMKAKNHYHGIITHCKSIGETPDAKNFSYYFTINSPLFLFKSNINNRIFLDKSVIEVLTEIFPMNGFSNSQFIFKVQKNYPKRECIIQYNESDYEFYTRLLSFWGLFFTWLQQEDNYQLIITDDIQQFDKIFPAKILPYYPLTGTYRPDNAIFYLQNHIQVLSQNVQMRNYNPQKAELLLNAVEKQKYNNFIPAIGSEDRYGEHVTSQQEAEMLAEVRQNALDWQRNIYTFYSDDSSLQLGQIITLSKFFDDLFNRDYHIISLEHFGNQSAGKIYSHNVFTSFSNEIKNNELEFVLTYYNKIICIAANIPYKTYFPLSAKKYHGNMLAKIESVADGSYAYLDQLGNYHFRFPFDQSDSPKGQASPTVRLTQSYSGNDYGMHFPLRNGTQVLLTFENGDIDRPILMGVLPSQTYPSPTTSQNVTQNILRTTSGHTLTMNDSGEGSLELTTFKQQHQLLLDGNENIIKLATQQGKMQLQTKKTYTTETHADYQQQIGNDHHVTIEDKKQITTQQGDIQLQAGRDLKLTAKNNIQMQSVEKNIALQSRKNTILNVRQSANIYSDRGNITINTPQGSFNLQANGISISALGKGDITIAQSGAMIKIKSDGSILAQGKQINVYAQQHNLVGTEGYLGGQGKPAPSPKPQMPTEIKLLYSYAQGDQKLPVAEASYEAADQDGFLYDSETDEQGQSILNSFEQGEEITLSNNSAPFQKQTWLALPIVEINGNKCSPWEKLKLNVPNSPNNSSIPDAAHTFHLTAIRPPIIKDYTDYVNKKSGEIPLLSAEELNYFKNNGNNATIFVHGFHVEPGYFGKVITSFQVDPTSLAWPKIWVNCNDHDCTLIRTLNDICLQFPDIPADTQEINDDLSPFDILNGFSAHNWFLHMEYNLNCAASGKYPFDWKAHGLDYTRIISVFWPGNVPKIMYLHAEEPAYKTGIALIPLIKQLNEAGIEINVIAHSLGSRVILTAMETMAKQGMNNVIDNLFLWEAAIPDTALTPNVPPDPTGYNNHFPNAYVAAKKITILYSKHDTTLWWAYQLAMREGISNNNLQPNWSDPNTIIWNNLTPDEQAIYDQDGQYLQQFLGSRPAMGYSGPLIEDPNDPTHFIQRQINSGRFNKPVDQTEWLKGHSKMRIPNKDVFTHIYEKVILNKKIGIKNFGKWKTG